MDHGSAKGKNVAKLRKNYFYNNYVTSRPGYAVILDLALVRILRQFCSKEPADIGVSFLLIRRATLQIRRATNNVALLVRHEI